MCVCLCEWSGQNIWILKHNFYLTNTMLLVHLSSLFCDKKLLWKLLKETIFLHKNFSSQKLLFWRWPKVGTCWEYLKKKWLQRNIPVCLTTFFIIYIYIYIYRISNFVPPKKSQNEDSVPFHWCLLSKILSTPPTPSNWRYKESVKDVRHSLTQWYKWQ